MLVKGTGSCHEDKTGEQGFMQNSPGLGPESHRRNVASPLATVLQSALEGDRAAGSWEIPWPRSSSTRWDTGSPSALYLL